MGRRTEHRLACEIGKELKEALLDYSAETDLTQSAIVQEALSNYFELKNGNGVILKLVGFTDEQVEQIYQEYGETVAEYGGDYKRLIREGLETKLTTLKNRQERSQTSYKPMPIGELKKQIKMGDIPKDFKGLVYTKGHEYMSFEEFRDSIDKFDPKAKAEIRGYGSLSFNELMAAVAKGKISSRYNGLVELKLNALLNELVAYNKSQTDPDDRILISVNCLMKLAKSNSGSVYQWLDAGNREAIERHHEEMVVSKTYNLSVIREKLGIPESYGQEG